MTIKQKMIVIAGLIVLGIGGVLTVSLVGFSSMSESYSQMRNRDIASHIAVIEINRDVNYVSRLTRNIMLGSNIDKDSKKLDNMLKRIKENYIILEEANGDKKTKDLISKAERATINFVNDGIIFSKKLRELDPSERHTLYREYGKSATPLAVESRKYFGKLSELKKQKLADATAKLDETIKKTRSLIILVSAVVLFLVMAVLFMVTRSLLSSINNIINIMEVLATNDLTGRIDASRKGETGQMLKATKKMKDTLVNTLQKIITGVSTLSKSSTVLTDTSGVMSSKIENVLGIASSVSVSTEEMSSNMSSIANAAEESSSNISMVSAATEEMTLTVHEIAKSTEKTLAISNKAVKRAENASSDVARLSDSAKAIGKVVETINDISEQTNLLALNATIEAARAGEAGKGFAVVANEIKDLAKQTAGATLEIKERIRNVQESTESTVSEIEQITGEIETVNEMIGSVSSAIEEQSATTKEIAENVAKAAVGIQEVTHNVSSISVVAGDIAKDITVVHQASNEISESNLVVRTSADDLSNLSKGLQETVNSFKI